MNDAKSNRFAVGTGEFSGYVLDVTDSFCAIDACKDTTSKSWRCCRKQYKKKGAWKHDRVHREPGLVLGGRGEGDNKYRAHTKYPWRTNPEHRTL